MAQKRKAPLKIASTEVPSPPTQVPGSVIFGNIVAIMSRGMFSGADARTAAEAILFLQQVTDNEKRAEEARKLEAEKPDGKA